MMKRNIVILTLCVIIMLLTTSCNSIENNQNEKENDNKKTITLLQDKIDCFEKIYDAQITKAIDKYCECYLSFEDCIDVQNVKKLKNYLTSDLYTTLLNKPYSENVENEERYYLQSTAVNELFYQDISSQIEFYPMINQTTVLVICTQSIISDDATTSNNNLIYKFKMEYRNNQWLISSVESIR